MTAASFALILTGVLLSAARATAAQGRRQYAWCDYADRRQRTAAGLDGCNQPSFSRRLRLLRRQRAGVDFGAFPRPGQHCPYPMLSIGHVVNVLAAGYLFDDTLSGGRWLGIGFIGTRDVAFPGGKFRRFPEIIIPAWIVGWIRRHAPQSTNNQLLTGMVDCTPLIHPTRSGKIFVGNRPISRRWPALFPPTWPRSQSPTPSAPPASRNIHIYKLIRLNFDLVAGFSLAPLQMFSLVGIALSLASAAFMVVLAIRRLIVGPEAEGLFTLFGINFLLMGILLFGIDLLGEYVGRIYPQVRDRPRFTIQGILERREEED